MPTELSSKQRKYLRGLAHDRPVLALLGKEGLTEAALAALDRALADHELVKVRFLVEKEKAAKREHLDELARRLGCGVAGLVGHVATLYRRQQDPKKRKIVLPD